MGFEDVFNFFLLIMIEFLYLLLLIKLVFRFGVKIKYGLLVNLIDFWNFV